MNALLELLASPALYAGLLFIGAVAVDLWLINRNQEDRHD